MMKMMTLKASIAAIAFRGYGDLDSVCLFGNQAERHRGGVIEVLVVDPFLHNFIIEKVLL
jgi:hypothetical protein